MTSSNAAAPGPSIEMLYFAGVKTSLAGEPASQTIELPPTARPFPLSDLRDYLIASVHPENDEFAYVLRRSAWSVNEEMIDEEEEVNVLLRGGETVCPIPPVSGG
ncbi:hypothetical protein JCM10908_006507 [Rhodotorula pacifica]|uniref:uncharacterized protein n=1 Tax=Rhodotorula pacifica TaxID=1495444 RepID=UPI00316EFF58